MKIAATLSVVLLMAGVANASLSIVVDTPVNLGTVPSGSTNPPAGSYYGVTVHFVSSDTVYKAGGFALTISGTTLQWRGSRGDSAGNTFWLDDLTAQTHDNVGDGASLTPLEAAFASHTLIGGANWGNSVGGVPGGPAAGYGLSNRVSGDAIPFFGDVDDGYQARVALQPWIWQDPAKDNYMAFAIFTAYRRQDLPFMYLVLPAGGSVRLYGDVAMSTAAGDQYRATVDQMIVPEPASLALLAVGVVALIRRKRRA